MLIEPKEEAVVADRTNASDSDFDAKSDEFFNLQDKGTPEDDSSASKDDQSEEQDKETVESEDSLKTSKETESEPETEDSKKDPRDLAFRKGYNEAKAKLEPIAKEAEILKGQIEEFKKVTSSPDYIRFSMKNQGYTEDAINSKLKELGHQVVEKQENGLDLVLNRLGVDINKLDDYGKNYVNTQVSDMIKVADILIQDRLSKILPNQIQPLQEALQTNAQERAASEVLDRITSIIETEGVLDLEKDIAPILDKFMEDNPKATQKEIYEYFERENHKLTLERMRQGKKKESREESKKGLRSQKEGPRVSLEGVKKTGKFDEDANAVLDALGVNN